MSRVFILIWLFVICSYADNVSIDKVQKHKFLKKYELNSKVIQLSNSKQAIMSLVSGHIEKYFVEAGQSVKRGDKIAYIDSMQLSKMSADYISLKRQSASLYKNYRASKNLYEQGMISLYELNKQSMLKDELEAKLTALRSQLKTLGVDIKNLKKASSKYILYAHKEGKISELLKPLHSVIDKEEEIVSIVQENSYYLKSYLPLKYAKDVKIGDKIVTNAFSKKIVTHVTQILPEIDEQTQMVILLSNVNKLIKGLFINAYIPSTIYFGDSKEYLSVKSTALSFFNNEWVVFVPKEDHDNDEDEHKHKVQNDHDNEEHEDDEHEHEHKDIPYEARVVEVILKDDLFTAIKGLNEGEEYVSDKSYYIKSLLLKSSLGGHGH